MSSMSWFALGEIAVLAAFLIGCLALLAWLGKVQRQHPEAIDWHVSREESDA